MENSSSSSSSSSYSSASVSSTQTITDLIGVLSESKRIISSHSRHFLALSVLFLLPLSFSLSVFPTLFDFFASSSHANSVQSLLRFSGSPHFHLHPQLHNPKSSKTLVFLSVFMSFFGVFGILGVSAVTSSVYNGFYGRPVKVLTAIRSGLRLFFPLLGTFFTAQVVIFSLFGFIIVIWVLGTGAIGLVSRTDLLSFDSPYFFWVCLSGAVVLGLSLVYNCVNWTIVSVIVIVERKWGIMPLYRSRSLMRGMRWVALMLIMFFGFFEAFVLWVSMVAGLDEYLGFAHNGWNTFGFVLQIVGTSAVLTVLLLHSIAATTVLYMYCKALHGELAGEIFREFATEYVSLPFDENKVPHVVCVVN